MDFIDDARIILYANSLGTEKFYVPDVNKSNRYKALGDVIEIITQAISEGKIKFVSDEFKAKALSLFIEATDQKKYSPFYAKLKDLPVPQTPDEKEEFDREVKKYKDLAEKRFINGPSKKSPVKEYPNLSKYEAEEKFTPRVEYVNKALALLSKPKTQRLSITKVKELESAIKQKKFDDESSQEIMTALYEDYDENFGEEEVPIAKSAIDTPSVPDAKVVDPEREAIVKSLINDFGFPTAATDRFKDLSIDGLRKILNDKQKIKREVASLVDDNSEELGLTDTQIEVYKTLSLKDADDALEVHREAAAARKRKILDKLRDEFNFSQDDLNALFQRDSLKELEEVLKKTEEQATLLEAATTQQFPPSLGSPTVEPSTFEEEEELVFPPVEEQPVIEALETEEERRREIEAGNRDLIDELTPDERATLFKAPVRVLENWIAARRYAIAAEVQGNVDHDEADNGADDGFFGLRNNYINAILLSQQYDFNDFLRIRDLLKGQPVAVYDAALQRIRARPNQAIAFDQQFLNEVLQQQNDAGNIVEGAAPQPAGAPAADVDNEAYAGLGALFYEYPRPPDPEPLVENKPQASGAQPITGTGADSEKLIYRARVHPDVIEIFFGQASFPAWDPDLEKKLMSMELSEARRVEIMDDVIAEYGKKIFIKQRKGSSKEELNELVQLQFCVMRNLQRGPRASTASIKVADLVRMQALAAGSGAPNVPATNPPPAQGPLGPEAQQVANIQAAGLAPQGTGVPPKPMITEARGEITNAQVQSFSEAKFISDYSKMQMAKNLNSGVPLQYPNPVPKVFNNQTPQTVNHPGRSAGLGRRRVGEFSAGKF
jgi:hypothetical protein